MNLILQNNIKNSDKKYRTLEQIKFKIRPYLKASINYMKTDLLNSMKLSKLNFNLNYDNVSIENYYTISDKYNKNIDNLRQNILSYFIPSNITKEILAKFIYYKNYKFSFKNRYINLHLFIDKKKYDYKKLVIMIAKAFAFLEFTNFNRRDIELYYIPTNFKKKFPDSNIIGPNNVNSAFTSFNYNKTGNRIVIFREEEAHKVLIHELVHYINMDFTFKNQNLVNKLIIQNYDINPESKFINLFEAYTDATAIIYNCILNSILLKKSISNLVKDEIDYQYKLLGQILKFSNMTHILKSKNTTNYFLKQKSNVLAYYFIKYGLMKNPDIFLENFNPNINWSENKILEIYNLSKMVLSNTKFNFNYSIKNNKSLRMTYNNINVI